MTAPRRVSGPPAFRPLPLRLGGHDFWLGCLCLRMAAWCFGVGGFEIVTEGEK